MAGVVILALIWSSLGRTATAGSQESLASEARSSSTELKIRVTDSAGYELPQARVTLFRRTGRHATSEPEEIGSAFSQTGGEAIFELTATGLYDSVVELDGFVPLRISPLALDVEDLRAFPRLEIAAVLTADPTGTYVGDQRSQPPWPRAAAPEAD